MDPFEPPLEGASKDVLHVIIRFTNSFDLPLDVPRPGQTSVVALKHAIRLKLDPPLCQQRFRLIYAGKLLKDDDILPDFLKLPLAPLRLHDPTGKGKAAERPSEPVYINCSIGDILTPTELVAEAEAAKKSLSKTRQNDNHQSVSRSRATATTPRGFDRLLAGGFTAGEVNQLRLQFRSIQQSIHTPETMPSPNSLLRIEDAWIDDNSGNGPGAARADFGDDGFSGGAIDDILWGNIIGFLWPLGCIGFLMRESGVWSRRRQISVFTGFILSMAFGILRALS